MVARYKATISTLTTVHRECGQQIDWNAIAMAPDPSPPAPITANADAAEHVRHSYRPNVLARLFGVAARRVSALARAVDAAREEDRLQNEAATEAHLRTCADLEAARRLARRILEGDLASYTGAIDELESFEELESVGAVVQVNAIDRNVVAIDVLAQEKQVVPSIEETFTAGGKHSSKKMPASRGNEIYQDHVCGAALRACREVFAALPAQWHVRDRRAVRVFASRGRSVRS